VIFQSSSVPQSALGDRLIRKKQPPKLASNREQQQGR